MRRDLPLADLSIPSTSALRDAGTLVTEADLFLAGAGSSQTPDRFRRLAAMTGLDVVAGKLFESHLDALQIVAEILGASQASALRSAVCAPQGLWGVWASEGPGGSLLTLAPAGAGDTAPWRVSGRKSWCSGAAAVGAALVTARNPDGVSCMVAVPMDHGGVQVTRDGWEAVGMAGTDSVDVLFDDVPAWPVGKPGEYTGRPGFWHGAAGIAACWHGAAMAIAEPLRARVRQKGADADGLLAAHLGAVDCALSASATALHRAANAIDQHRAGGPSFGQREALQVRATVEAAAQTTMDRVGRALGAAPLCRDRQHAARVADLSVFLRQSHADWDLAVLGRLCAAQEGDIAWTL